MTLLNVFRGFANVLPHDVYKSPLSYGLSATHINFSSARSWCDEHFVSLKVLERAAEIRSRLSGMLYTFLLSEKPSVSGREVTLASSAGLQEESALIRRYV